MKSLRARLGWISVLVAMGLGCSTPSSDHPCVPACRSGFVCASGACVSACNPACAAGQACTGTGASAACVSADGSPGVDAATDAPVGTDVPATNDAPSTTDVPVTGMDVPTGTDAPAPPDATSTDVAADATPTCGLAGQACCDSFCEPGNQCANYVSGTPGSGTCRAITRAAGECSRPGDCAAGQACSGPQTCVDHGCFVCATASGAGALGAVCTTNGDCATGVCRGGRCTTACALGTTGDADCARGRAGDVCTELNYGVGFGVDAGTTSIDALGTCRQGCARNGDCTAPQLCAPFVNDASDRLDFVCATLAAGGATGASCTDGSTCQTGLCLPGTGATGTCTAPCVADGDCTAGAPHCVALSWYRPRSGGLQPGHACAP